MIAFVDSSVILRLVARTLDRLRFAAPPLDPQALAGRREVAFRVLEGLETIEITRIVLSRAAQPLPTPLGTPGSIHLVSAMGWREQFEGVFFAAHDLALSAAARESGLEVVGTKQWSPPLYLCSHRRRLPAPARVPPPQVSFPAR